MTSPATFLDLPVEVRLEVYEFAILEVRVLKKRMQPYNWHFSLLRTCRQMYAETRTLVFAYVSLLHERQIRAFIQTVPSHLASLILYADVANDGRIVRTEDTKDTSAVVSPLSHLNIALSLMPSLKHLRVFECKQGFPAQPNLKRGKRLVVELEEAMFPAQYIPQLETYELYLSSNSRISALKKIDPKWLERLRLSGNCTLPSDFRTPALSRIALKGVTGTYFDRRDLNEWCQSSVLTTFVYTFEDRMGFELRDQHLLSLAYGPGRRLRKLVLLGCSRLSSAVLAECLRQMDCLQHLALSLITVAEQRTNIMAALPTSLRVFKFRVRNAWYATPLFEEEEAMCDLLDSRLRAGDIELEALFIDLRAALVEGEREEQWRSLASETGCMLRIGSWKDSDIL